MPRAEAVAVREGRFVAVGTLDEVRQAAGPGHVLDETLAGSWAIAGLIDQHLHPMLAATTLTTHVIAPETWQMPRRTFAATPTEQEWDRRLLAADGDLAADEWLFSWGFHSQWHGTMSRQRLDALVKGRPVAVWQRSCHEWYLNTVALERIGLTEEMTRGHGPASSQIDFGRGHFWENGWMLVLSMHLMPHFMTEARFREGLAQMTEYLHMNGVTAINEPGIYWRNEPWPLYQEMLGAPDVPFESTFLVEGRTQPVRGLSGAQLVDDAREQVARGTGTKVRVLDRHVKLFCDGAIISQLMQMKEPYLDGAGRPDPSHHGEWMMEPGTLREVFDAYWDAGWQVHIHVNGDLGLETVLDVLEDAQARTPRDDHRTVVVHFANSAEAQVERIARLGAIVSANPYYPVGFADKYAQWGLGPERADMMVRAGSVRRHGIPLSYHSDLPMCPSDPLMMASWGATRITHSGRVAGPSQRITAHDALRAVTIESAYSWRREHELGSVTAGKLANMTVLGADPLSIDPSLWGTVPVLGSVYGGEWFPVNPELVARRVSRPGAVAVSNTDCAHDADASSCGCAVAGFLASYAARHGWAA